MPSTCVKPIVKTIDKLPPPSRCKSTRRHFIVTAATAAGGFAIGIGAAPHAAVAATVVAQPWNDDNAYAANEIDAWIAIDPDDSILIRYQRSEMGQGSMTALPMMITEELQCDWSKVRIEYASPNRNLRENKVYGDMFSNGSRSVRGVAEEGAAGRRQRARAPDRRGRGALERCGDGMPAAHSVVTHTAVGPHPALWRVRRGRGEDQARPASRRSRRRTSSPSSASRCRASTWSTRSTARPSSASTRRYRAWCSPRSRPARSPAASSRASMSPCLPARPASCRW